MQINEIFKPYLDNLGLISYIGEDGSKDMGDCCANQFTYLYCTKPGSSEISRALLALTRNGIPIRHPDKSKWYSSTNRTSRDQLLPYLFFVSTRNHWLPRSVEKYFWRLLRQHVKHALLFAWNTRRNFVYQDYVEHAKRSTPDVAWNYKWKLPDFCGPNVWSAYCRGIMNYLPLSAGLLYPLVCLLDLWDFLGLMLVLIKLRNGYTLGPLSAPGRMESHDKRNRTLLTHFAAHNWPSIWSYVGWKLWKPYANKAATSFWTQRGEPPIHKAIELLD